MVVREQREPGLAEIDIELRPPHAPTYQAIVALRGPHDMPSAFGLRNALASVGGDVLVDLTGCASLESSIVNVLLSDAARRRRDWHTLELIVPPSNETVRRTLEAFGVPDLLFVHPRRQRRSSDDRTRRLGEVAHVARCPSCAWRAREPVCPMCGTRMRATVLARPGSDSEPGVT